MESENTKKSLSTEPYKGVRDFYPEDMFIQKYIFSIMRKTVESFGYVEYNASILEPTELYKVKSGEEIINEQTYSFKDRGDRDITLRPEMTPTITRMIAARKRELSFPLRWYSIPNLFRYEKPQRGRLREHFQLNVDLFGIESFYAEVEIISLTYRMMENFNADPSAYVIKINNRKILNYLLESVCALSEDQAYTMMKLIDKKNKMWPEEFKSEAEKLLGTKTTGFLAAINTTTIDEFSAVVAAETNSEVLGVAETKNLMQQLEKLGIHNAVFDPTLARGFDYYTGFVFELFDVSPKNPRAILGGGRFDDLLSVFGTDRVPAVGFGAGDVTIKDFLESYNLIPKYISTTSITICVLSDDQQVIDYSQKIAQELRQANINCALDVTPKKISQKIQTALKQSVPYILVIGENEVRSNNLTLKELSTGTEHIFTQPAQITEFIAHSKLTN